SGQRTPAPSHRRRDRRCPERGTSSPGRTRLAPLPGEPGDRVPRTRSRPYGDLLPGFRTAAERHRNETTYRADHRGCGRLGTTPLRNRTGSRSAVGGRRDEREFTRGDQAVRGITTATTLRTTHHRERLRHAFHPGRRGTLCPSLDGDHSLGLAGGRAPGRVPPRAALLHSRKGWNTGRRLRRSRRRLGTGSFRTGSVRDRGPRRTGVLRLGVPQPQRHNGRLLGTFRERRLPTPRLGLGKR